MVYEEGKIYGPYTRKDGRQHKYTTNKQLQSLLGETLEVEPAKTGKS